MEIGTHEFTRKNGPMFSKLHRVFHASCCTGEYICIFGGFTDDGLSNEFLYYTQKNELLTCKTYGEIPVPRALSVMASIYEGNKLFVYGGMDSNMKLLNDLYVLEESEDKTSWHRLHQTSGDLIPALAGHTCVSDGNNCLYVFGGYGTFGISSHPRFSNSLFSIQVSITSSNKYLQQPPRYTFCTESLCSGPPARAGHAVCIMQNALMFVFGGHNEKRIFNDLWTYYIRKDKPKEGSS